MILKNIKLLKDYFIKIQSQYDFYNFLFLLFVYILGITCKHLLQSRYVNFLAFNYINTN